MSAERIPQKRSRNIKQRYPEVFFILCLLIITRCTTHQLSETEEHLTGAWSAEIGSSPNGNRNFTYIELNTDRKGVNAIAVQTNDRIFLGTVFEITEWKIKKDTLIINYIMTGGLFSAPGMKDTLVNDFQVTNYWIIREKSENEMLAESYDPAIPFTSVLRFARIDRITARYERPFGKTKQ
jgi:hypothetical protein